MPMRSDVRPTSTNGPMPLASALLTVTKAMTHALWPSVADFAAWVTLHDPAIPAADGTSSIEALARLRREDLMAWAASRPWCTSFSQASLMRALRNTFSEGDAASARVLLPLLHLDTLNAIDEKGGNVLHNPGVPLSLIGILVDRGVDVHRANGKGQTPLMVLMPRIYDGTYSDVNDLSLCTGDHLLEPVQRLLDAGAAIDATDHGGDTAFTLAAFYGDVMVLEALAAAGANVHHLNGYGQNALHQAANNPWALPVVKFEFLINAGVAVNVVDRGGNCPLHQAARHADVAVMRTLMDAGADVSQVTTTFRKTVLMDAMNADSNVSSQGKLDLLLPLVDLHLFDWDGLTALDMAIRTKRMDDAFRLMSMMRTEVAKAVLQRHVDRAPVIREWLQDLLQREVRALCEGLPTDSMLEAAAPTRRRL